MVSIYSEKVLENSGSAQRQSGRRTAIARELRRKDVGYYADYVDVTFGDEFGRIFEGNEFHGGVAGCCHRGCFVDRWG
jgi:hypothetical protein